VEREHDLFLAVLAGLDEEGALQDIVLIGGWCLLVYREYFEGSAEIPMKRTTDLDFMVPNPPKIHRDVDVPLILEALGFDRSVSLPDGLVKYVHPDLEVEFLTPDRGKGRDRPYKIDKLHVEAQGLRFLDLLQRHVMNTSFHGMVICVPEPAAYTLHKFIISGRRTKAFKRAKDMDTACSLGEYLLGLENQRHMLRDVYNGMHVKWKKELMRIVSGTSSAMYEFLNSIEKDTASA
jgi:hypothetical protein